MPETKVLLDYLQRVENESTSREILGCSSCFGPEIIQLEKTLKVATLLNCLTQCIEISREGKTKQKRKKQGFSFVSLCALVTSCVNQEESISVTGLNQCNLHNIVSGVGKALFFHRVFMPIL